MDDEIERFLGTRPRALDGAVRASGQLLNERHSAQIDGATNLLTKAVRARRAGDEPKAATFIERACAMPYDEREEVWPGPWAAHLLLFGAVLDVLESSAEDDERWLDAALQAVAEAGERERAALVRVLTIVAREADGARLTDREARRVEPLVAGRTLQDAEDAGTHQDATIVDRCLEVSGTLSAAIAYARQVNPRA